MTCPGVAKAAVSVRDGRLVADLVGRVPTRGDLRRALWSVLPGVMCPADVVGGSSTVSEPDTLTAMWAEIGGRLSSPNQSYWQDFSFLHVLTEAREAGLDVPDAVVVRCRTPEMLAAALAARR